METDCILAKKGMKSKESWYLTYSDLFCEIYIPLYYLVNIKNFDEVKFYEILWDFGWFYEFYEIYEVWETW